MSPQSPRNNMKVKWVFVETVRNNKKTGAVTRKLDIYLCNGNKVLRETTEANGALHFERKMQQEEGWEFENSMNDFFDEQKLKLESQNPEKFKHLMVRMTSSEFKKWRSDDDKPQQMRF